MILLDAVTKRFGAVTAVDRVSFRAEKGKFVVLLGPSGCGKSTLLRLIAGLEQVSEGKILIEGRDVTRRDIAPQSASTAALTTASVRTKAPPPDSS